MSKNIQSIKKNLNIVLRAEGNNDISLLILRVTTGLLMFFGHGLSKLTAGTARWEKLGHALTDLIGLDSFHIFFGFLASLSESIGALLVAFGLVTRFSSFFLFFTMAIASLKHLLKDDFSELALIYASICLVIMISGSGKYSLDYYLFKKND
jgi:putative oxidoreductase